MKKYVFFIILEFVYVMVLTADTREEHLLEAIKNKNQVVMDVLLKDDIDLTWTNSSQRKNGSFLHYAVNSKYPHAVHVLLEAGVTINTRDSEKRTPLYDAVDNYNGSAEGKECIRLLLDNGADVNLPQEDGETPLHAAVNNRDFEMVNPTLPKS